MINLLFRLIRYFFKFCGWMIRPFIFIYNYSILRGSGVVFSNDLIVNGKIFLRNKGSISIGKHVVINSNGDFNPIGGDDICRIVTEEQGHIRIGDHVGISNSTIYAKKEIIIDEYVNIGGGCKIWDTDFHSLDYIKRQQDREDPNKDDYIRNEMVHIKRHAFIGGGSIILKGVVIGEQAIVAAGSVVTKSIPDYEIWGGNPAKKIR